MKALVLKENGRLVVDDTELRPQSSNGEITVQVVYAGVCSSDLPKIFENGSYYYPAVLGHEIIGRVVEPTSATADLVAIYPLIHCGACEMCQIGKLNLCRNYSYIGSRRDGGFAEQVRVPKNNIISLPENLNSPVAVLTEPTAVLFHALHQANLQSNDHIAVIGDGSMGLIFINILKSLGYQNVWLIGKHEYKLLIARQFGAQTINRSDSDSLNTLRNFFGCVFELAGNNQAYSEAISILKPLGQLIFIGNIDSDFHLPKNVFSQILRKELTLVGSWNSLYPDWQEAMNFLSGHPELSQIISHTFSLEEGLAKMQDIHLNKLNNYIKVIFKL